MIVHTTKRLSTSPGTRDEETPPILSERNIRIRRFHFHPFFRSDRLSIFLLVLTAHYIYIYIPAHVFPRNLLTSHRTRSSRVWPVKASSPLFTRYRIIMSRFSWCNAADLQPLTLITVQSLSTDYCRFRYPLIKYPCLYIYI